MSTDKSINKFSKLMDTLVERVMKPYFRSADIQLNEVYGFFKLLVRSIYDPIMMERENLKNLLGFSWLICGFLKPFEEQNKMNPDHMKRFLENPNAPPPIRISYDTFKSITENYKKSSITGIKYEKENQCDYIFDKYDILLKQLNVSEQTINNVKRFLRSDDCEFDREKYILWCEIYINSTILNAFINELLSTIFLQNFILSVTEVLL